GWTRCRRRPAPGSGAGAARPPESGPAGSRCRRDDGDMGAGPEVRPTRPKPSVAPVAPLASQQRNPYRHDHQRPGHAQVEIDPVDPAEVAGEKEAAQHDQDQPDRALTTGEVLVVVLGRRRPVAEVGSLLAGPERIGARHGLGGLLTAPCRTVI